MGVESARAFPAPGERMRVMLTGDVMLGRGIDQILPNPSPPELHEPYVRSALTYVSLAEKRSGAVPGPVAFPYVWGEALQDLDAHAPDLRIINLETAVTRSATPADKEIHYRMNPANLDVLRAAAIDCCVLANNHLLDWGPEGLLETLDVLGGAGFELAGAGRDDVEAEAPAVLPISDGTRILVYAFAFPSSGVPPSWAAGPNRPGVHFLEGHGDGAVERIAARVSRDRRPGDRVIASIHWGPNWGYDISSADRAFARRLIEQARIDVVHGHSSHHPKGIELHRGRPILYGCGDLINDYEGISGEEAYRPDLALIYLLSLDPGGACRDLEMFPYRIARFRLNRAASEEVRWLADRLDQECSRLGGRVTLEEGAGASSLRLFPSRQGSGGNQARASAPKPNPAGAKAM